jgi:pentatricopeptide repeat protein
MAQARDMDKYMRGMVDTCFEEGQYEAGIATLDQLRASGYAPAP